MDTGERPGAGSHQPTTPVTGHGPHSDQDRNWGVAAHASAVVGAWIALGLIGPLVVLVVRGGSSPFVRAHAVEALNFNISILIYAAVAWLLTFVLIGIPVLVAVGLLWLVCTVLGIIKASRGELYRYPLSIRVVH